MQSITETTAPAVITPEEFLHHWQGHRTLTRRVIEAFPEKEFFTFSIGGMRPAAVLVQELLAIAAPGLKEMVDGVSEKFNEHMDHGDKKAYLLKLWDESTVLINEYWSKMSLTRFHEEILAFGQYPGTVISSLLYFVDNEIHHRGQMYVYLRALNIEPPAFWDRP
jgi:uncharacterized damage-inducible protein DinB